ncbi:MAG: tyrosine-type recombinase/integrase [Lachnospiraceae bacterium]|nr:tyrosine-type recombinase/integrase [Lachnospiraceae bacterium]
MNIDYIKNKINDILHYLEDDVQYAPGSVYYYSRCYENILKYCEDSGYDDFSRDIAQMYSVHVLSLAANGGASKSYSMALRKAAFVLVGYLETGEINWKYTRYGKRSLTQEYRALLSGFVSDISTTLSDGSVNNITSVVSHFLFFLEENGYTAIGAVGRDLIADFIARESPRYRSGPQNLTGPIKKFMHYLSEKGAVGFDASALLANPAKNRKKVLPCFQDSEVKSMLEAVDRESPTGKRDYAMMVLAMTTGMRCVDIRQLLLSEIDWRNSEIRIVQEKTGTALVLPLMPDAGNAVADYILNARPKSSDSHVFLRARRPYTWLKAPANGAGIMKRCQEAAGIGHSAGDGRTFHAFRRTAGTNMISSGIPLGTVSQMLGHNSLESTRRYLSLHDGMLAECCMEMGSLLTRKEGLE